MIILGHFRKSKSTLFLNQRCFLSSTNVCVATWNGSIQSRSAHVHPGIAFVSRQAVRLPLPRESPFKAFCAEMNGNAEGIPPCRELCNRVRFASVSLQFRRAQSATRRSPASSGSDPRAAPPTGEPHWVGAPTGVNVPWRFRRCRTDDDAD